MGIAVMLVDDHRIVRKALRAVLEDQADMNVIAEAGNGRSAVRLAIDLSPRVVVMDISMPDLDGIEAARQIVAAAPDVRVLMFSVHSDRCFVTEAFAAGASGYLLKDSPIDQITHAIRTVAAGKTYLCPRLADIIVD